MSGVGIAVVALYGKREMGTEMGQYTFHLGDNIKIEHKLKLLELESCVLRAVVMLY